MIVICPYCGANSELVSGKEIYPHRPDLYHKKFYRCLPCEAYVGCYPGAENKPLGRLANAKLRAAKLAAHSAFDPIWMKGLKKRKKAYQWLSEELNIERSKCHIGMFDIEECRQVIEACKKIRIVNFYGKS